MFGPFTTHIINIVGTRSGKRQQSKDLRKGNDIFFCVDLKTKTGFYMKKSSEKRPENVVHKGN